MEGMSRMEFQVTVTIAAHGADAGNGVKFVKGFWEAHPEVGAVVDQNTATAELSVTFGFEASDLLEAGKKWPRIFIAGAKASGLPATTLKQLGMAADVVKVQTSAPKSRASKPALSAA